MAAKVAQMTKDELKEMIGAVVEQKLIELLADPDVGLVVNKALRNRLLRQLRATSQGERGEPLEQAVARLGLA